MLLKLLYRLDHFINGDKLGAIGFYPIPRWIKKYLARFPRSKQLGIIAKLVVGTDLSYFVNGDVGCAESCSRLIREVVPGFPVITGTYSLDETLRLHGQFVSLQTPIDGCIVMAATGTGNGKLANGHVGIYVGGRVFSNNSFSGKWDAHYSLLTFKQRYFGIGAFPIRYYSVK